MFRSKNDKVQAQQLKVQELVIRTADTHLYEVSGSDVVIDVSESVAAVVLAVHFDNSAAATAGETGPVMIPAASLSASGTEITVASVTLATNDVLVVKYILA